MPKETWGRNYASVVVVAEEKKGKGSLPGILIVFHAVLTFPRETFGYQRLPLLHSRYRNQRVEEDQEHVILSACWITTVSLRPKTQIRRRKR